MTFPLESRIQRFYDSLCEDHDYLYNEQGVSEFDEADDELKQLIYCYSVLSERFRIMFYDVIYTEDL